MKAKVRKYLIKIHYRIYSALNSIIPKKNNYIFIYDAQFMRQNCWALYRYLIENGYDEKYKVFFYTEKKANNYNGKIAEGFVTNPVKGWFLHLLSRYTFYEYHNFKFNCKPGNKQVTMYLTHGTPLKNYGYLVEQPEHPYENDYTYLLVTCEYYIPIMKRILGCSDKQIYLGGMPRCDQLFTKVNLPWICEEGKRNVLWMPTFRKSSNNAINDSKKEFPILNNENICELDKVLGLNGIRLIIKPHPFQDKIPWLYAGQYENISVVFNEDLQENKIELYEMLGKIDMLITDYSSVYSDFLLTQKPMAFVLDDIEEYKQKRGFVDDTLIERLPGPIITTYMDFADCICNIDKVTDSYRNKRENAQKLLSPYPKMNSFGEDLCQFLMIHK